MDLMANNEKRSLYEASLRVLADIRQSNAASPASPLRCFHFWTENDEQHDRWGDDAIAVQASRPLFADLPFRLIVDYVGGSVGVEAWEKVTPDAAWLNDRLPRMWAIARAAEMRFLGWTYETGSAIFQASP